MTDRLPISFYQRDVLDVAPLILGQSIVRRYPGGDESRYIITETEAYRGEEDLACHASKGKTERNRIMYAEGGHVYVYLIYGMYFMLNVVTGTKGNPQAVLIRGIEGYQGPGKLTKHLQIDKSFYGENLTRSDRIWIEPREGQAKMWTGQRIGIAYAGDLWQRKPWRYVLTGWEDSGESCGSLDRPDLSAAPHRCPDGSRYP